MPDAVLVGSIKLYEKIERCTRRTKALTPRSRDSGACDDRLGEPLPGQRQQEQGHGAGRTGKRQSQHHPQGGAGKEAKEALSSFDLKKAGALEAYLNFKTEVDRITGSKT